MNSLNLLTFANNTTELSERDITLSIQKSVFDSLKIVDKSCIKACIVFLLLLL